MKLSGAERQLAETVVKLSSLQDQCNELKGQLDSKVCSATLEERGPLPSVQSGFFAVVKPFSLPLCCDGI